MELRKINLQMFYRLAAQRNDPAFAPFAGQPHADRLCKRNIGEGQRSQLANACCCVIEQDQQHLIAPRFQRFATVRCQKVSGLLGVQVINGLSCSRRCLPVLLDNAKQARNIPGRKTDVNDATWLANLAAHELLRASFIPSQPIRELRDLTRARTTFVRDRTKVYQRMEKFLESSGIMLSSVASSLTGVSARNMLQALIDGERDATVLAELAQRSMRRKIPQLIDALDGRFTDHHPFMMRILLRQIDELTAVIDQLTVKIDEAISGS